MADDNYNPVFSEPLNDIPNKEEITEKPNSLIVMTILLQLLKW